MKLNHTILSLVLVIILSLGALRGLISTGYFPMHDDLQVMRLYQMEKCLKDGQVPCRLVPDMGYGYSFPLFNFYPPGPYYLGVFIKFIFALTFIDTVKILFGLSVILSAIFMFFLARNFWGNMGGIISSVLFVYAPYHSVDIYVRGAMNEVYGLTFFPLIFLSFYKLAVRINIYWFYSSVISLFCLFLSHNIMTLIFTPWVAAWFLFWIVKTRHWRNLTIGGTSFIFALGLASFFLLPAVSEQSLIQIENLTSDYFNFSSHFVSLYQLFLSKIWGFGPSEFGSNDRISFQIGWPHWWLMIVTSLLFVISFLKKINAQHALIIFLGLGFLISIFMTHAKSLVIWSLIPSLQFVQFPWRFLSLAIFFDSFLIGCIFCWIKELKLKIFLTFATVILTIFLNVGYFDFEHHFTFATDQEKLSGEQLRLQKQAGLLDYLPKTNSNVPKSEAPHLPVVLEGDVNVRYFDKRSDFWSAGFQVLGDRNAKVEIPIFEFPNWQILINNKPVPHGISKPLGLITVDLPPGKQDIAGWFENTPIRILANTITAVSFLGLVAVFVIWSTKNKHDT